MNLYLMGIERFFIGEVTFKIEAENKTEAMEKGRKHMEMNSYGGNYNARTLRVVKKLQKK